jgi:hypothetical protein
MKWVMNWVMSGFLEYCRPPAAWCKIGNRRSSAITIFQYRICGGYPIDTRHFLCQFAIDLYLHLLTIKKINNVKMAQKIVQNANTRTALGFEMR